MRSVRSLFATVLAVPLLTLAAPATADPAYGYGSGHERGYALDTVADGFQVYYGTGKYRRYYEPPATCVAVAFRRFGEGKRIRGTRGVGHARFTRRACKRALRECNERLYYAPAGPRARCVVVRSS